ncbi:MAG: hypothetical protein CR991_06320 [Proteobacteria bacterium]|nr:MAG: hypothetical protein CR991_06320 [Pseudomonadota bacterium]
MLNALISLLVTFLLSRQMVKPISLLRRGIRELTDGNYATRIHTVGCDELGQLSHDFNHLAARLQQHEQARQQWMMDITHELRTPLSILRGEIEAIQDDINTANPQTIQSLHQETLHLQRLVDDLYALSMSDNGALSYQKERVDIIQILRDSINQFTQRFHEQALELNTDTLLKQAVYLHGDAQRLQQLFHNLLKNSLRYTDSPGLVHISAQLELDKHTITIIFEDSAPGVPNDSLPKLFERLYRVEHSRNRTTSGAGIGLSICHNIVTAHNGAIQATHSHLGGLKITLRLPL